MWQDNLKKELQTVIVGMKERGEDTHDVEKVVNQLTEKSTVDNTIKQLRRTNLNWFAGKLINNLYK